MGIKYFKKLFSQDERIKMYVCPECKEADKVFYDSKGGYVSESIYYCKRCSTYFMVKYYCKKCNSPSGPSYGCSNSDCNSKKYEANQETKLIERKYED